VVFDAEVEGMRLDAALARTLDEVSRSRAERLISEGNVSLNGKVETGKSARVQAGDRAVARFSVRMPLRVEAEDIPIDIVYEDDDIIVVNKPQGMVVHPAPGNETGTLVGALLHHVLSQGGTLPDVGGEIRAGIVHRIDKNTSGLLVCAKSDRAHASLSEQLAAHSVTRVYLAIVCGGIKDEAGIIDAPIGRDPKDRKKQKVMHGDKGRRAVTHWEIAERLRGHTLLTLRLETGRTHQIRVHLAHNHHPLLCDDLYGPSKHVRMAQEAGEGQYLHAGTLGFVHPADGRYLEFTVPPPEKFTAMVAKLRK
jgi:23S rRNA pseudouridine1911/1915/1917 synthase